MCSGPAVLWAVAVAGLHRNLHLCVFSRAFETHYIVGQWGTSQFSHCTYVSLTGVFVPPEEMHEKMTFAARTDLQLIKRHTFITGSDFSLMLICRSTNTSTCYSCTPSPAQTARVFIYPTFPPRRSQICADAHIHASLYAFVVVNTTLEKIDWFIGSDT